MTASRVDAAWLKCKDWITDYDGQFTEASFLGVRKERLLETLCSIQSTETSFESTSCENGIGPFAEPAYAIDLLEASAGCDWPWQLILIYTTSRPGFPVRLQVYIYVRDDGLFFIRVVWWADRVFDNNIAAEARFYGLFEYLFQLGQSLDCECIVVGHENASVDPHKPNQYWTSV